jgi:hypothetical protein
MRGGADPQDAWADLRDTSELFSLPWRRAHAWFLLSPSVTMPAESDRAEDSLLLLSVW